MAAYDRIFETNQIGQIMDCSLRRIDSYKAVSDLEFGKLVSFSVTGVADVITLRTAESLPLGITVYDRTKIEGKYKINTMVNVLTFGRIMVEAFDDIEQGQLAYAGAGGQIRIEPTEVDDDFPVGVFLSSALTGEKVLLEFRV